MFLSIQSYICFLDKMGKFWGIVFFLQKTFSTQNPFTVYVDSILAKKVFVMCKMCRHLCRPERVVKCNIDDDD